MVVEERATGDADKRICLVKRRGTFCQISRQERGEGADIRPGAVTVLQVLVWLSDVLNMSELIFETGKRGWWS